MKALVFVPGIMGTEMITAESERVWPPRPTETVFGYGRTTELLKPDTRPGDIIERVACFDVYGSILKQIEEIGYTDGGAKRRLYRFPYDWRLDLETTAQALAEQLRRIHADGASEIIIAAHSMGGLVARLVLETGLWDDRPWFEKIRLFTALATPHLGAPLALARVLGIDSTLGVSKNDFRRIAADPRYPSGYQLLPAPGEDACWNQGDDALAAVDIYDPADAARLGLEPAQLARARWLHDTLAAGRPPGHVRYFYFAGLGHETATRVNVRMGAEGRFDPARMVVTRTPDAGDGTVPMWSALPRSAQKQTVVNEHASVFTGRPFLNVFQRLIGGAVVDALERVPGVTELRLTLASPVQPAGAPIELVLAPDAPLGALNAKVVIEPVDETGTASADSRTVASIDYAGPPLTHLRVALSGVDKPGLYRLRLDGACPGVEATPALFSASAVL